MRTLILGTFPPHQKQWDYPFYYPNRANHFWKILAEVGKFTLTQWEGMPAVEERKFLMRQMRVGVQNIGLVVERENQSALDKDISVLKFQDLLSIINSNDSLQKVLLTGYSGKTSTYREFTKYLKMMGISYTKPDKVGAGFEFTAQFNRPINCLIGNSTSPTAQRGGISFEMLVDQFRKAITA
jgi:G:T/U-mismatch repair DNA glycosylase